ncbi:TIGR03084 family metal-binding protein [Tomitella biformata]|uniref:TIGR03084 family metal-binding protein n=1 Tax=Tomitella biformata TaxID=630403 RepID=UPI000464D3ED|nr:TIGR03084 family metal-binding protein [Tomitella biformata]
MAALDAVLADLTAEGEALDALVAGLAPDGWTTQTPADGWTIAHQIAHLSWTDGSATLAATDAEAFQEQVVEAWRDPTGFVDKAAEAGAQSPPARLLAQWRTGRRGMVDALAAYPEGKKLPWYGPPMSATSMATARIMETWAHGEDVADALGVIREPTARLRHVAHIGVRARNFAFSVHELAPPAEEFRVELTAPAGGLWTWGPEDAAQKVTGPALDFCLLVTQRRHLDDTALAAQGDDAQKWLTIAQAFAGTPGGGRAPLDQNSKES